MIWKRTERPPHPRAEMLERTSIPWLLACALATGGPHAGHLPFWLNAIAAACIALRAWLWHRNQNLPARWQITMLVIATTVGIYLQYHTLFGRDAGVALLVLFVAMKPLEMQQRRDAIVLVMLGFFLLLTHYFYSQSIPTGLWLVAATMLQAGTLLRLHGGMQPVSTIARDAAMLLLQASIFMLVLFVLFPRVSGPLWGLPQDAYGSKSGLPETIDAGTISDLVLDGSIAFRARFNGPPPANARLYWRGPVMDLFDGRSWHPAKIRQDEPARIESRSAELDYETTLEPHNQRWLLALDAPVTIPEKSRLNTRMQVVSLEPVRLRSQFRFGASLDYRVNTKESQATIDTTLQLPVSGNPRARALATQWRDEKGSTAAIIDEALHMFRQQEFIYTLHPPLLGEHSVDEFLFETRKGFCEHYASAFVFLMRAAGIPARIVAGYQGGEINPIDNYLVVRQSDAHAWAEVWLDGQGWQRVDPTAAIAPERIEHGIASALPEGEARPAIMRVDLDWLRSLRFRWEAINNAWNQWVLGYNPERQREVLSGLGLHGIDWRGMAALLAAICGAVLLAMLWMILVAKPQHDPAQRIWLELCARLARQGLKRESWEGPVTYAVRVAAARPDLQPIVQAAANAYIQARYGMTRDFDGSKTAELKKLRTAIRKLPRKWSIA